MDQILVNEDICVHVSNTLDHDEELATYSAEEKKMVETALTKGVHGM